MKKLKQWLSKKTNQILTCIIMPLVLFLFAVMVIPLPDPIFEKDYSTVILDENGHILRAFLNSKQQWYFPPQMENPLPFKLKQCILLFEDRFFYHHPGVNPLALVRATGQLLTSGKVKSGGSTITMQVVRLAYKNKRTLWNKLLEIFRAIKLDFRYNKEEILKMYVNHAPYGSNIIGYHAASLKYFYREPDQLTWSQAATLAVLPNSPGLIAPQVNPDLLIKKRNRLLKRLWENKHITEETYHLSISEPITRQVAGFFNQAPHLAQTLLDNYPVKSEIVRTTIIKKHQEHIETLLANHLHYLHSIGVHNGAALIVETQTRKVRAYVGSQDFFDSRFGGQVDGIQSPRSSGSVFKPFLYAMAIDEGFILPGTMVRDIPTFFGSFSPANANGKYNGVVTAQEALIRSLNVPAVRLLNTCGVQNFYLFLKAAGVTSLFRPAEEYGLPLILGGAEVSLFDLAQLYCSLGNQGKFKPLQLYYPLNTNHNPPITTPEKELLSPGAAYLTLQMLQEVKRPGTEFYWEQYQNQFPIAWKTGTSYGQRDAWAIGVTPQWTIAVWVGNFAGEGNCNLSGAQSAAPLLFDIFNYLPKPYKDKWFKSPDRHMITLKVCLETGFAAGPDCEKSIFVQSPASKKPLALCPFHKRIFVTNDEKWQVCSLCWENGNYKSISRLIYPPDIAQYLRESGVIINSIPRHKKQCVGACNNTQNPMRITYPVNNARLWIPRDFDGQLQQITLSVAHRLKDSHVYWYIDNQYKGTTNGTHKLVDRLSHGKHNLEVVDESGNRTQRKFFVSVLKH